MYIRGQNIDYLKCAVEKIITIQKFCKWNGAKFIDKEIVLNYYSILPAP